MEELSSVDKTEGITLGSKSNKVKLLTLISKMYSHPCLEGRIAIAKIWVFS